MNHGKNSNNLQKNEEEVSGVPSLYVITSMGNKVEDEGETGAVEDVVEKDLWGCVMNGDDICYRWK